MGYHEYLNSLTLVGKANQLPMGNPFYSLLMAAIREADTDNLDKIASVFPEVVEELTKRYNAPGGHLQGENYS